MNAISEKIIRYRPPRISMLLLAFAVALHTLIPAGRVEVFSSTILSVVFATGGFAIMMWAWWLFQKAQTAICPTAKSTSLITTGIYRYTRNPMYLGVISMMAGTALWFGTLPFYGVTLVYFVVVDRVFCAFEEQQMEATFGQKFRVYLNSTRRWL